MLVTMEPVPLLSGTAALSVSDRHLHICALELHVLRKQRCSDGTEDREVPLGQAGSVESCGWLVPGAVMGLVGEVENKGQSFPVPLPSWSHSPTRDRTDQEEMDSSIFDHITFPVGFQRSRGSSSSNRCLL